MRTADATYYGNRAPLRARFVPQEQSRGNLPVVLAAILFYTLLIPTQFNITIADVYLSPFRIYLIGATLYILAGAARQSMRFVWPDLFMILTLCWIWIASYFSSGSVSTAVIMGGSHTVDIGLSYFLARASIQTVGDFRRLLVLIAPGAGFISAIVVLESITHTLILQRVASSITGAIAPPRMEVRIGLMRGWGSFPHPILAGICLGSLLPIYMLSGLRGWPKVVGVLAAIGGIFSLSSAAMLAVVVGGLLCVYDWLTRRIGNLNWRIFLLATTILYAAVELTSKSGFYSLLVRYVSLNTATAYNRVLIWNFGTANVAEHPWFGIGYADWDRPDWMHSDSFDHFWLITALRFGIPAFVFMFGATMIGLSMIALKSRELPHHDATFLRGTAISVAVFALGVNSVSLWMAALAWFFMLLGITVSLGAIPRPSRPSLSHGFSQRRLVMAEPQAT